jgi:enterochelin esterase family protein
VNAQRRRLIVLALTGLLVAAGAWVLRPLARQTRPAPGGPVGVLEAAIADIQTGKRSTPLISAPTAQGDVTVTFLARTLGGQVPRIVSDVTGWGENADNNTFDFTIGRMTRIGHTDWYALDARVALGARIEYFVVHGPGDYRFDPHNPRRTQLRGGGPSSEFVTPGYLPPPEFADPPVVPAGTTTEGTVASRALGGSRRVTVYTPPGYREGGDYPVAVFQDGFAVVHAGEVPRLLDYLITRKAIEPIVAAFAESHRYGDTADYADTSMRTFLTRELLTWMASRYAVTRDAGRRAILGVSYSAKDAFDAAVNSTGAFDRVGLVIPGRRLGLDEIAAVSGRPGHRLRVAILAGQYDHANLATARGVRQALAGAGHAVDYIEVPEGHSRATWRNHMGEVLVSLFGTRTK